MLVNAYMEVAACVSNIIRITRITFNVNMKNNDLLVV